MKLVPGLILRRVILLAGHEAHGAVELQLRVFIKVGEGPAQIERRPVAADKGIEVGVVTPGRNNAEQVKGVREALGIPAELELKVRLNEPALLGRSMPARREGRWQAEETTTLRKASTAFARRPPPGTL